MTTKKPDYNLAAYVEFLTAQSAQHQDLYDEFGSQIDDGYARGFRLALAALKIHTNGDYGQSLAEQNEAAKAKLAAEKSAEQAAPTQPTGAVADVPEPGPWESSWQAEIRFAAEQAAEVTE